MSVLTRWARYLYPYAQLKRLREQDDKQEAHEDPKQIRIPPTLSDLQLTMDPLLAAQIYNDNHSPLCRLPDELLLRILHCLGHDILSIYCLRRVSRSFRRLVNEPDIWKYMLLPLSQRFWPRSESPWNLPPEQRKQLRQRLQRDNMCPKCKLWCDVPVKGWFKQISQALNLAQLGRYRTYGGHCKFGFEPWDNARPQCSVCNNQGAQETFSSSSRNHHDEGGQRCLGCQGAVQLCEHINIYWATIEAHITDWQRRRPGDWQACFDDFSVECQDPSHDTRCTAEEAPTWPRARLQFAELCPDLVILLLEWKPHSGLDTFTPTADGRALASEMRALFRKYRQGPADILFPSYPSNPLPEMACFGPATCNCLRYDNGVDEGPSAVDRPKIASFLHKDWPFGCRAHHYYSRDHGSGRNGQQVQMSEHWPTSTYRDKVKPTHPWFHAMNPDTYSRPIAGHELPLCKDKDLLSKPEVRVLALASHDRIPSVTDTIYGPHGHPFVRTEAFSYVAYIHP
ncbi:hypothetical protein V8C35DRAFT_333198 [Trichoderma chlorosporum]